MADCMMFPNDWVKFLYDYSFLDDHEVYTNGAELIPTFRVEQMMEHYLRKAVADKWIPVTERLPEELKPVLTWHGEGYFPECGRWTGRSWETTWEFEDLTGVTHWMLLPEPPKEE